MDPRAPTNVELVPATLDDIDFLFALKSEPDSVYWGGFAAPPAYASLKKHYEGLLAGSEKKTLLIRVGGQRAGVIGYRIAEGSVCADYSINVAGEFAGRGVGRSALERHIEQLRANEPGCREIVALIREDNPRSQRIFAGCGYSPTGDSEVRFLDSDQALIRLQTWTRALA